VEPRTDASRALRSAFLPNQARALRVRRAGALLAAAFVAASLAGPAAAQPPRILVAKSADTPRLDRTLTSLRELAALPVDIVPLSAGDETLRGEWARSPRGSVLVALGPRASDAVVSLGLGGPIVHCLAGPDALRAGAPSVPSEVPVDQQATWLAKLVPSARTIALLFDPAVNTRRVEAHVAALRTAGFRTLLEPVASPAALPAALDSLAGRADLLLARPDATVYTRESSRGLLLYSFRKRIPIAGPSLAWVKMGALYAVDWDYAEVGATCAALAVREADARTGAPPPPPRPRVFVNVKSAAHFGIAWNADLLKQVDLRHE
jgi:putative ABC transport system substrate-binding protein